MHNIYICVCIYYGIYMAYMAKSEDCLLCAPCTVALFRRVIVADKGNVAVICKAVLLSLHDF